VLQAYGGKAAVDALNATGGIVGRKLVYTELDTQGDPTTAVSLLQQEISSSTPPDIVLSEGTAAPPIIPLLTQHKILTFASWSSSTIDSPSGHPYTFSTLPGTAGAGDALSAYVKQQGWSHVAVAYSDDTYGDAEQVLFSKALASAGITATKAKFSDTTLDVTPVLQQLRSGKPDALLVLGYGPSVAHLFTSLGTLGWSVPLLGDAGVGASNINQLAPAKTYAGLKIAQYKSACYVPPAKRSAVYSDFLSKVKKRGTISAILTNAADAWDALQLIDTAATQAKSTTTENVTKALENLTQPATVPYVGLQHESFSSTNHRVQAKASDFAVVDFGTGKLVDGTLGYPNGC
jgi:branched-chain amino acid transport system substrate-binding protein